MSNSIFENKKLVPVLAFLCAAGWSLAYPLIKLGYSNLNVASDDLGSKININTADLKQLDDIPGVGEATANKILSYRDENGEFKSIEEIKNVNGIGDKKFENMKDLICVK